MDDAGLLHAAMHMHRVSRRRFLVGSGLGLGIATDLYVTRQIQEYRMKTALLALPDEYAETHFPTTSWILFPGYKTSWEEARWILNSLRPAMKLRGQMAAVGYSNRGLDIHEIFAEVRRHIRITQLETVYFYGHSFGGMVAVQVAAMLREIGVSVEVILLDSSPESKYDVLDQAWFEGVVYLYEHGYRIPSVVRGGYELSERVVHKNERSWRQILNQTLEQLSPLAPSSVLIQSESAYIYAYDSTRFRNRLGDTEMVWFGNPEDGTVNYQSARTGWAETFPENMVSNDRITVGAVPPHASPQWNSGVYEAVLKDIFDQVLPVTAGGGRKRIY